MAQASCQNVDDYIAQCPEEARPYLIKMRAAITQAAPEAAEKISWGMPTFVLGGNLVHFAAAKKHVGFYPAPSAILAFADRLTPYRCSKGAVQFPYAQPLPIELIQDMVHFRVKEQLGKD